VKTARLALFAGAFFCAALLHGQIARAPTVATQPQNQTVTAGGNATLTVVAAGTGPFTYQWRRNGASVTGATAASLAFTNAQPADTGLYTVVVTNAAGSVTSSPAILGVSTTSKVIGAGTVFATDIPHPNGNIYDQVLLSGAAAAVTAEGKKVTRTSFIDLTDDIVQVEFGGAGTLSMVLDGASGPAPPLNYNQSVSYMKGHVGIVITGADDTTNVSVFSVGRITAVNQGLFKSAVTYDGRADLAFIAIMSANGKFGGVRTSNGSYYATQGVTGIYAPGVQFTGPVYAGEINASDTATPMFVLGSATNNTWITGGDLFQANGQAVIVSGVTQLKFVDGTTSHGVTLPAQATRAIVLQDGTDVTSQLVVAPTLYYASLRPAAAATSSTAAGYATIFFNPNATTGAVNVSFSNLTSDEVVGHLVLGSPGSSGAYVFNLGRGQVSGATWTFAPTGNYSTSDLVAALKTGQLSVEIDSANFPSGELLGSFIATAGSKAFVAPAAPPALPASALTAPTQTDAARFLTQATFGPTAAEIDLVTSQGITKWINDQMVLTASSHLVGIRADVTAFPNPPAPANADFYYTVVGNRIAAWWKIVLTGPDQLRQRVAFALSEIFVMSDVGTLSVQQECVAKYNDVLVTDAFSNFRQLLDDITLNPAMGSWLTYFQNQKADPVKGTSPDENYARELQQLFTIGLVQLQPDGTLMLDASGQPIPTYDQTTISETAKVFTGWAFANSINDFFGTPPANYLVPTTDDSGWLNPMVCYDAYHDKTQKNVVSVQQVPLDQAKPTVIPANETGPKDLKVMLDTLFNHPNTGPFVCKQLIQRLVTSNPSPGYVYRVAQAFANDGTGTRGNLGAVVKAILTDYEARSPDVLGNVGYGKIKEPLLRASAFFRILKAGAPNGRFMDGYFNEIPGNFESPAGDFVGPDYAMNQSPLRAPTVFNFFSPTYSVPGAMAAAGLVAPEMQITDAHFAITTPNWLTNSYLYRSGPRQASPPAPTPSPYLTFDFSELLTLASTPAALVDKLNLLFCANQMSAATRNQILTWLQDLSSGTADLTRVQNAIQLTIVSQDGALQR